MPSDIQTVPSAPGPGHYGCPNPAPKVRQKGRVGLFSTVPVEAILAAGLVPVDLNNLLVTSDDPAALIQIADTHGVPRTLCAWTRGMFGAVVANGISEVVAVEHGDCSANRALAALLESLGIRVIRFHYPLGMPRDNARPFLAEELERFCGLLGTSLSAAQEQFISLKPVRLMLQEVDQRLASGTFDAAKARLLLLSSTDMKGDPGLFAEELSRELAAQHPVAPEDAVPVVVAGVPAILGDLVEAIERSGATIRLFEVESDFAMIPPAEDLTGQYQAYAYAHGLSARLARLARLTKARNAQGVVLYNQTSCHHNLEGRRFSKGLLHMPLLLVEGDTPGPVSQRDRLRLEAFVEQLRWKGAGAARRITDASAPGGPRTVPVQPSKGGARLALDIGSRFTKVWFVAESGAELRLRLDTMDFYKAYASHCRSTLGGDALALLRTLGIMQEDTALQASCLSVACTGYGRNRIQLDGALVVPEIQAHALGAAGAVPYEKFMLVDIGGQDTKVMVINDGLLESFIMNDKCAAGTGRYIENMGRLLNVDLEYVLSASGEPVMITSTCATFGESEVVGHVVDGVPMESICSGILKSVADRTLQMIGRLPGAIELPVVLSGGVAGSAGLRGFLAQGLGCKVEPVPLADFNGARGVLVLLGHRFRNHAGPEL